MEDAAEDPPVTRLGAAHVRPVRLDPAPEREVVVGKRLHEQRDLVGGRCHVRVGKHDQIPGGREHPCPDGGSLADVRD